MTNTTTTQELDSIFDDDVLNLFAISRTWEYVATRNKKTGKDYTPKPTELLTNSVYILLFDGHEMTLDRVETIASKQAIGISRCEAIEAILADPGFITTFGNVFLAEDGEK